MLDNNKQTTSRLKRILNSKANVVPLQSQSKDLDHQHSQKMAQISSPVLQHSTSIYSLASPTRTSFEIQGHSMDAAVSYYDDLYQPLSPPPPIPLGRGRPTKQQGPSSTIPLCTTRTINSVTPISNTAAAHTTSTTTRGRRSHSVHHTSHPDLSLSVKYPRNHLPPMPTPPLPPTVLKKSMTDITTTTKKKKNIVSKDDDDDKHWRRHSYSSHHRSRPLVDTEPQPPLPSAAAMAAAAMATTNNTASSSLLLMKASPAANVALASSSSLSSVSSFPSTPPSPSTITSTITTLEKSRSTPLRHHQQSKVKTYNVSPTTGKKRLQRYGSDTTLPSATQLERDLEKKKRQQELEDLISGRRGSTLKLSLTPKNTLLN